MPCRKYQEMSFQLHALAAAGGVETRSNKKWLTVAELRSALMEILAPPTEVGCVKKWVLTKLVFLIEVECSSHGAILIV